jgi:hypothetical protein
MQGRWGLQTPHPSASNIAGTITVAIVPMPAYTTTFVSTYITKKREEAISAHISSKHKKHTHTISVIVLHLIIVLKRTTFTNLKHNCLLLRII